MLYAEIYAATKLLCENNCCMIEKCLRAMQGGYNMNIRCNQKCVFCNDRGIDFTVCLCRG